MEVVRNTDAAFELVEERMVGEHIVAAAGTAVGEGLHFIISIFGEEQASRILTSLSTARGSCQLLADACLQ